MRSESELQAAGRRASMRAVPTPPPVADLQQRADKMTTKRRMLGSSLAALALVAIGVPVVLNARGSTTVQNVVAGTSESAPAAQVESPPDDPAPDSPTSGDTTEETVHVQVTGDDMSFSLRVLHGDEAAVAAAEAEARAGETIDVDGLTVWVSGSGDERVVAALVEPDVFTEVRGNTDQLDELIDMLRRGVGQHDFDFHFGGPDDEEWESFFGEDFDPFVKDWFDGFDPDDFDGFDLDFDLDGHEGLEGLEGLDGFGGFNFRFDEDGFSGFGQNFDHIGSLEDLLKELENHRGDIEQFFGQEGTGFPFAGFGEDFDGCISIETNTDGETSAFTFPDGCR